jgi:hypothetical protein
MKTWHTVGGILGLLLTLSGCDFRSAPETIEEVEAPYAHLRVQTRTMLLEINAELEKRLIEHNPTTPEAYSALLRDVGADWVRRHAPDAVPSPPRAGQTGRVPGTPSLSSGDAKLTPAQQAAIVRVIESANASKRLGELEAAVSAAQIYAAKTLPARDDAIVHVVAIRIKEIARAGALLRSASLTRTSQRWFSAQPNHGRFVRAPYVPAPGGFIYAQDPLECDPSLPLEPGVPPCPDDLDIQDPPEFDINWWSVVGAGGAGGLAAGAFTCSSIALCLGGVALGGGVFGYLEYRSQVESFERRLTDWCRQVRNQRHYNWDGICPAWLTRD